VSTVQVRHATLDDGRTEFDEIVASNCTVHLEKMDDGKFYLGVETATERVKFWIFAKRGRIDAMEYEREQVNARSDAQRRRWARLTPEQRKRRRKR
jgi:hypothetical protein